MRSVALVDVLADIHSQHIFAAGLRHHGTASYQRTVQCIELLGPWLVIVSPRARARCMGDALLQEDSQVRHQTVKIRRENYQVPDASPDCWFQTPSCKGCTLSP